MKSQRWDCCFFRDRDPKASQPVDETGIIPVLSTGQVQWDLGAPPPIHLAHVA